MKNIGNGFLVGFAVCLLFLAAAETGSTAKVIPKAQDYNQALAVVDSVLANIVLVRTPSGDRGLTRADVDELRRCMILLQASVKELESLKTAATPEATSAEVPPTEAPK